MIRTVARLAAAAFFVAGPVMLVAQGNAVAAGDAAVQVRIQDQDAKGDKVPLPGVGVSIETPDGTVVGKAVTNATGVALVDGLTGTDFVIDVDTATLPKGKALLPDINTGETGPKFKVTISVTGQATKNLFTGARVTNDSTWLDKVPQRILDGTRLGLLIAITSVGLSLIFGTTGLTNFAHGELVTFGGTVAFLFNVTMGIPLLIAAPITIALGGAFGLALDYLLWSKLRKRGIGLISQMVVSVGLSILLRNAFLWRFGGRSKPFGDYATQEQWHWWKFGITPRDFTTSLLALVVLVTVALSLQRTRLGKATRAVADNTDLASATGIDTQQVIRLVWIAGGALAALGGIIRGLDQQVSSEMGGNLLFLMFAGITLGGLGSAFGALVGGFVVGVFTELLSLVVPTELKNVPPLLVLIGVLLVRPQGILGKRERVG